MYSLSDSPENVHECHTRLGRDVDKLEAREKKKGHHEKGSPPSRTTSSRSTFKSWKDCVSPEGHAISNRSMRVAFPRPK